MSHTNSTTNYNLPQFVGSDKPAWLGDINPAMSAIDTAIKNASDSATTADGKATTAQGAVDTLDATVGTLSSTIETQGTQINTNTGSINNINSNITSLQSEITALFNKLNLSEYSDGNVSATGITNNGLKLAQNTEGSLFKVYGVLLGTQVTVPRTTIPGSTNLTNKYGVATGMYLNFAPDEAYQIDNAGYLTYQNLNTSAITGTFGYVHITVGTDGQIYIWASSSTQSSQTPANVRLSIWFPSSLYFNTNFGDNGDNN